MATVYRYVGEPMLTRGEYGERIEYAHTRIDDPEGIYIFDATFGDFYYCDVDQARERGLEYVGEVEYGDGPKF